MINVLQQPIVIAICTLLLGIGTIAIGKLWVIDENIAMAGAFLVGLAVKRFGELHAIAKSNSVPPSKP